MSWEDVLFASGSLFFIAALLPMVRAAAKPPLATSVPTGLVLVAFLPAYAALGLWAAFASTACTATLWLVLAIQRTKEF